MLLRMAEARCEQGDQTRLPNRNYRLYTEITVRENIEKEPSLEYE